MNELIRELMQQAGFDPVAIERMGVMPNAEKFAELIIRECFDVVINDGRFHDANGIIRAGKCVAMEHFGVK